MLYSLVGTQIHFFSLEIFENDIDIAARLNLTVLRPRYVYKSHVICNDDREMGGLVDKGQCPTYNPFCLPDV